MGNYRFIEGTVTSPMGFTAAGICASIKPSNKTKRDLALIYCDTPCTAAAVYTKNLVKSSAIEVTKKHLEDGIAQAVIVNSGNANTCNANGYDIANHMCLIAGETLGVKAEDVIVASTGVIGQPLPIQPCRRYRERLFFYGLLCWFPASHYLSGGNVRCLYGTDKTGNQQSTSRCYQLCGGVRAVRFIYCLCSRLYQEDK